MRKVVAIVFVVALLAGTGFVLWQGVQTNKARSAEAQVEILDARVVRWWDSSEDRYQDGHDLRYRYQAGDHSFDGVSEHNTWYKPATALKVCYDPANPRDHVLGPADQACGVSVRRG